MNINRIETVIYGVDDVDAGIRYFDDWGLKKIDSSKSGALFQTAENQHILVRARTDGDLPTAPDDDVSTVREVLWGVDSTDTLEAIAAELSTDREVRQDADGTLHAYDVNGFGIGFRLEDRTQAIVEPPAANLNNHVERLNREFSGTAKASPIRIGHVVYNSVRSLGNAPSDFYMNRLGFRLSDRTLDAGDFMRCAGSNDHHTLFLMRRRETAAFNHIAFEVRDFDEIMAGGAFMKGQNWTPETVAGRHILGSNMFWYFQNPCGGNTEYFADMDRMDDNWEPRVWEEAPGFALWTVDGETGRPASFQDNSD